MKRATGMSDTVDCEQILAAYFPAGRLAALPRHLAQLHVVLETVQARFEPDQRYSAYDVDRRLVELTDKPRMVRAALLSLGYLHEEDGVFTRAVPPAPPPKKHPGGNAGAVAPEEREQQERERVLAVFFKGDRLVRWPSKLPAQLIVLAAVQARFAPDREYAEQEVNTILLAVHDDYCT